jgi:hypothetical protein
VPLEIPKVDDRSYQEILNEALARIRVHNPEWNNFNESDPGVTILELFAFMTESLLYRSNLIPERNRRKFLSLLGIPMQPAAAARGMVTFVNERGPLQALTLSADLDVLAGQVPFRTESGLDVLPVEARVYYKRELNDAESAEVREIYAKLYGSHSEAGELRYYETRLLEPPVDTTQIPVIDLGSDTLDGSLWVALLARPQDKPETVRPALANKTLSLGILPAYTDTTRVLLPGRMQVGRRNSSLVFEIATDQYDTVGGVDMPHYDRLTTRLDTDILTEPGVVQLTLPGTISLWETTEPLQAGTGAFPPSLEDTKDEERLVTWIRIRLPEQQIGSGLSAKLSWAGVNATMVSQRAHVAGELLGRGSGEPDQSFTLVNKPVIPDTVQLLVDGVPWQEIDDLLAAGPEVPVRDRRLPPGAPLPADRPAKVFTVDRESGEIRFGTGAAGARPPAGSVIRASYDYGGGRQGNVNPGAISKAAALPAGLKVINPLPTWGGDEPETVAEAERSIPKYVKHQDRLVTAEDFKAIVQRTPGVDIGRVEVLPLFNPEMLDVASPGMVTVMVVPRYDVARPDAPSPDRLFLDLICDYLDPRRLVTTEVYVRGPKYVPIVVSVGVEVVPGRDFPNVREAVNRALKQVLSPLVGGRSGEGWPLQKAVLAKELWAEAARVDGVAFVKDLLLGDEDGSAAEQIPLTGLALPWLWKVDTREGDPEPLAALLGRMGGSGTGGPGTPGTGQDERRIVPIPVIPPNC